MRVKKQRSRNKSNPKGPGIQEHEREDQDEIDNENRIGKYVIIEELKRESYEKARI